MEKPYLTRKARSGVVGFSPLTDLGITQAKLVRDYFQEKGITFDKVYSSTQERATDTLKLITNQSYQQLKGLKEMNFGIF